MGEVFASAPGGHLVDESLCLSPEGGLRDEEAKQAASLPVGGITWKRGKSEIRCMRNKRGKWE